jgi:hypothetical protein
MESTNWRSVGKKIDKVLINAVTVQMKYYFTFPVTQLHRQVTVDVGVEAGNRF